MDDRRQQGTVRGTGPTVTSRRRHRREVGLSGEPDRAGRGAATKVAAVHQDAVREVFSDIRYDLEMAPRRVQPLLQYIYRNLFEQDLNVEQLKRACRVRSSAVPVQFRSELGESPGSYIESRRLETAKFLLADTPISISRIAELLGYSSIQVFSRAFRRREGEAPGAYRRSRQSLPASQRAEVGRMSRRSIAVMRAAGEAYGALVTGMKFTDEWMQRLFRQVDNRELRERWEEILRHSYELEKKLRKVAGESGPQMPALRDAGGSS